MAGKIVTHQIYLGPGGIGKARHKALLRWARALGYYWGSKQQPSVSKLFQFLADQRIEQEKCEAGEKASK